MLEMRYRICDTLMINKYGILVRKAACWKTIKDTLADKRTPARVDTFVLHIVTVPVVGPVQLPL